MLLLTLSSLAALASSVWAMDAGPAKRYQHGLVGMGIPAFDPPCAYACREAISGATLNCSTVEEMPGMEGMDMGGMAMTDPECYATDDIFLQTMAWCMQARCKDVPVWRLEKYWRLNVPGLYVGQPVPKETYQQALEKTDGAPTAVYNETGVLNVTSAVAGELWFAAYNTDVIFGHQESLHARYGVVLLLSEIVVPIGASLLRFLPFPAALRSKFSALITNAPLFGAHQSTLSRLGLDAALTRGQALFILYLSVLNVVLSAVNYEYADPNTWYPANRWRWILMLVSNRLGILSFANLPLVFLYAGRNNLLLWLTNWSHSTFILLHRWIAGIATLQAILHSLLYLHAYVKVGTHAAESVKPYWYWGVVATLGMCILFPTSISPMRRKAYEFFLAWHVVISILVVAGCYWHIIFEFQHAWGYETWIIITMAVWGFDRVARVARFARHGIKTAEVSVVDGEYVRVVVRGVAVGGYAYLYFPTLTWRVWENHPFSVAATVLSTPHVEDQDSNASHGADKHLDIHAMSVDGSAGSDAGSGRPVETGITFYIRAKFGLTSLLLRHSTLPVLVETGYNSHSPSALASSPTLIVLVGGVGITAVLPYIRSHPGRVKLYWGCRTNALVDDVKSSGVLANVALEVFVGERMCIKDILEAEVERACGGGIAVLVSGPEGMSDEVRRTVGDIVGRKGAKVDLFVENFSW
ncbi:ferric reductase-like protein transmembrane component 4 [Ophiobolus disseminans]|uniref:Ferric reductase-like protein transmembrane component 4 n=1 Tax=Ophiobolus disseminans TaxID=1469910 RepID=A0A6A6ZW70_9PLEO|nr:ferric reductase-like protein transmembrane component 4 [Ophiobolus disseminans]